MSGNIVFDHVWKRFHRGPAHDSLRDLIPALVRRARPEGTEAPSRAGDFWAVRDVSFEVQPGQALGIIGGNGAGKSTILKLLTKVLTPNRGVAQINGRVGALIEVSAGFHGDLTGRENVFLQGAIMGMPQKLIREKFDEIVEFSGIAPFIDTPVKRYSSGMNARLGFAIAIHLEPEALIIDEVLSVGDAEFQGRAFERVRKLVKQDVPVVLVSHQLDRVMELCTDCILLKQGEVAFHGSAKEAVHRYMHGTSQVEPSRNGNPTGITLRQLTRNDAETVRSGSMCQFRLEGEMIEFVPDTDLVVGIALYDATTNQQLFVCDLRHFDSHPTSVGEFVANFELQANVAPGFFRLEAFLFDVKNARVLGESPAALFEVSPGTPFIGSHQLNIRRA